MAGRFVCLRTEVHRAEDESADFESGASELRVLHGTQANCLESTPGKSARESGAGAGGYWPTAAATATTTNIRTSTPAMTRFLVFGSTRRA
ncbi:hypothetical protein E6R62_14505 [Streptomyces sp. A1136]|nr:hypothetical protein E6R62_14505 [Streptomyces sp. A1136]